MITFSFWFFFLGYSYDTILIVFGITTYWYFVPCLVFFPELPGMLPESPTCARTRRNWPSPKAQMFSKSTWINTLWYSLINEESFSVLTSIFLPELGFCWISPVPSEYQSEGCGMGQKKRYRSTKKNNISKHHFDPESRRLHWASGNKQEFLARNLCPWAYSSKFTMLDCTTPIFRHGQTISENDSSI